MPLSSVFQTLLLANAWPPSFKWRKMVTAQHSLTTFWPAPRYNLPITRCRSGWRLSEQFQGMRWAKSIGRRSPRWYRTPTLMGPLHPSQGCKMWPTPHVLHRVAQCVGHPSQERLLALDRSRSNWTPPGLEKGLEKSRPSSDSDVT